MMPCEDQATYLGEVFRMDAKAKGERRSSSVGGEFAARLRLARLNGFPLP